MADADGGRVRGIGTDDGNGGEVPAQGPERLVCGGNGGEDGLRQRRGTRTL
jgi:hypothetical protein